MYQVFSGLANLDYNAPKDMYFYGFKTHLAVTTNGYILNYDLTSASVRDTQAATALVVGNPSPFVSADVGWLRTKRKIQQNGLTSLDTLSFF